MALSSQRPSVIESINPATQEVIEQVPATEAAEITRIMAAARRAQAEWAAKPLAARCAATAALRDRLYARYAELADCVTRETGKPLVEAFFADVLISIDTAAYYARNAAKLLREDRVSHHNLAVKAKSGRLWQEPYGVIGIISPWNYPLAIPLSQIIPAVIAGNAVVLKGSESTPACTRLIGTCFAEAGFPDDVVQVIQGNGTQGAALIESNPDKVIFTGSVETGRRVAKLCAERLIPSVLELGGKDAMIVLDDADLDAASSAAVWGAFTNCGQACLSVERIYVDQKIAERFTQLCVGKTRRLKLGPGSDPENEIGPMLRIGNVERIEVLLREAENAGGHVLTGGRRRQSLGPSFFEPTIIADADPSTRLMREEIFGPVVAIIQVRDSQEAAELSNDSSFGLSASIWTKDMERAMQLASRLRVGAVMVNDVGSYFGIAEAPHGGRGLSGWGRTHSKVGLGEMVQVKYVDLDRLPHWPKAWWFGYNREVGEMARSFIDWLYAPTWSSRWNRAAGAIRGLWRGHRI